VNTPLALCVAAACSLVTWSCESAPREAAAERAPAPPGAFAKIRGGVVDTSGRPVPHAAIVGPRSPVARTDESGRFEFRWFRRPLDLYAECACYYPSARGVGEPDGEPIRLVLSPKTTLRVNFA
jgi:hypothetical protein